MRITNVVCSAELRFPLDLRRLCQRLGNVRYDPRRFSGLIWKHPIIGGNCLVFSNGKINCNGKASVFKDGVRRLRRYARRLQKAGYPVRLSNVRTLTASAYHDIGERLDLLAFVRERGSIYEPELFPGVQFVVRGVTFRCFHTGKVIITGIKTKTQITNIVEPTLLELSLYTECA